MKGDSFNTPIMWLLVFPLVCLPFPGCGAAFSEDDIALFDSVGQLSGVVAVPKGVRLPGSLHVGLVWKHDSPNSEYPTFTAGASAEVDTNMETEQESPRFSLLVGPSWRHETLPIDGTLLVFVDLDDDGRLDVEGGVGCADRVLGVAHNIVVHISDTVQLQVEAGTEPCFPDLDCEGTSSLKPGGAKFGKPHYEGLSLSLDENLLLSNCPATEPLAVYGHCYAAREGLARSVSGQCPQGGRNCLAAADSPVGLFRRVQWKLLQSMTTHACCPYTLGNAPWFCSPSMGCPDGYVCCKDTCRRSCAAAEKRDVRWPYVPPGEFTMGSSAEDICREIDEEEHIVKLTNGFFIGSTEVTETDFFHVMGYVPFYTNNPVARLPVHWLTWHEAAAYCNRLSDLDELSRCYQCAGEQGAVRCIEVKQLQEKGIYKCKGYRLPTEAEWEYAYKAGASTSFYNGKMTNCQSDPLADEIAWYLGNVSSSDSSPKPVGRKRPNAFGLFDMAGNVGEWVHDYYGLYVKQGKVGVVHVDPITTSNDKQYVVYKGGDVSTVAWRVRGATRVAANPEQQGGGLRCVRSVP